MYGLLKVHKTDFASNFQDRLIWAAYSQLSYNISKFLVPILAPLTMNKYTATNSKDFARIISNQQKAHGNYVSSFWRRKLFYLNNLSRIYTQHQKQTIPCKPIHPGIHPRLVHSAPRKRCTQLFLPLFWRLLKAGRRSGHGPPSRTHLRLIILFSSRRHIAEGLPPPNLLLHCIFSLLKIISCYIDKKSHAT